jgi:hypothetical protein
MSRKASFVFIELIPTRIDKCNEKIMITIIRDGFIPGRKLIYS